MTKTYRSLFAGWFALALALPGVVLAQSGEVEDPDVWLGIIAGSSEGTYRGWPLMFEVSVVHPKASYAAVRGESVQPLSFAVPSGRWTKLVKLVIRNAQGELQQWPYRLLTAVGPSLTLDAERKGRLTVVLSPEATATLTPGNYTVEAFLDTRTGTTDMSWKGVSSAGLEFALTDAPVTPDAALACRRGYVFSEYQLALGNRAAAASALDIAITQAPDESLCLVARAELAEQSGDLHGAIDHYARALDADARLPQDPDGSGCGSSLGALRERCLEVVKKLPASERHPLPIFCAYVRCEERTDGGTCPPASTPASDAPGSGARMGR